MQSESKSNQTSLFDEYRVKKYPDHSFCWSPVVNHIAIEPSEFVCEGSLYICSEGVYAHCILTLDTMIACQVTGPKSGLENGLKTTSTFLRLQNPKLSKIHKSGKHGLKLASGKDSQEFLCESMKDMMKWLDCFKLVSILENIEECYEFGEVIGAGSSGIVRKARRRNDGVYKFAAKSIPKRNYRAKKHSFVIVMKIIEILNK